jgi:hypothetical protein
MRNVWADLLARYPFSGYYPHFVLPGNSFVLPPTIAKQSPEPIRSSPPDWSFVLSSLNLFDPEFPPEVERADGQSRRK